MQHARGAAACTAASSCVPPYKWGNCTTASLQDNRTSEHSAPSLPQWGPIAAKYTALGDLGSFLKASTGPERAVGDGRGRYVTYQGGIIYWTSKTGAKAMSSFVRSQYGLVGGGPGGPLGYPTSDAVKGLADGGWMQFFEGGVIVDSASTSTQAVWGASYTVWRANNREKGVLGYPTSAIVFGRPDGGWIQLFQKGAIVDSASTATQVVWGASLTVWKANGRETGVLGYPTSAITFGRPDGGWIQLFQKGAIVDSASTATRVVWGAPGPSGRPTDARPASWATPPPPSPSAAPTAAGSSCSRRAPSSTAPAPPPRPWSDACSTPGRPQAGERDPRLPHGGAGRRRQGGVPGLPEGRAVGARPGAGTPRLRRGPRRVEGRGRRRWPLRLPLTDTVETPGGRLTCEFEGGTITA